MFFHFTTYCSQELENEKELCQRQHAYLEIFQKSDFRSTRVFIKFLFKFSRFWFRKKNEKLSAYLHLYIHGKESTMYI